MCPRGHRFVTTVLTGVNLSADAHLLDELAAGGLQLVRCPACGSVWPIAEPIVIDDPSSNRAALFVPEVLAHRELELLGRLLEEVSRSSADEAPVYAADLVSMVGETALRDWRGLSVREAGASLAKGSASLAARIHSAFADLDGPDKAAALSAPPPIGDEQTGESVHGDDDWLDDREIGASEKAKQSRPAAPAGALALPTPDAMARVDYVDLMSDSYDEFAADGFDEENDGGGDDGKGGDDDEGSSGFGLGRKI